MSVTISTHNGSAVARQHNIRNRNVVEKEKHIDLDGIHEIWIDESPCDAYERIFGEAVADYNTKQKREDRKIKNYYDDVCKDERRHPVYEMIIGIYGEEIDDKTGKEIMREFVDNWKERNPNLEIIGAYYHADEEGQPHVHIDYIPVAHGYKRGMHTQAGLDKALTEQGFESKNAKNTAQIAWERRENSYLENLCLNKGYNVLHPEKDKNVEHLKTEIYKARQTYIKLQSMKNELSEEIDKLKNERDFYSNEAQKIYADYQKFAAKITNENEKLVSKNKELKTNQSMILDTIRDLQRQAKKFLEETILHNREDYLYSMERDIRAIDRYMKQSEELIEIEDFERD